MKDKKFLLNTKDDTSAAAAVCIFGLKTNLENIGYKVDINNWKNYFSYDYVIFMSGSEDIDKVRKQNSNIKIGIADPKPNSIKDIIKCDFCIVSSMEQREVYIKYNRNIFIYYMIPEFEYYLRKHKSKNLIKVFYHGNKVHLNSSFNTMVPALNEIGKKYNIELNVIYNIKTLGKWTIGRPDPTFCPTNDLQWYPNCYKDYFVDADIGLVPNFMPINNEKLIRYFSSVAKSIFLESKEDHILKYKSSSNAGRIFVFGYFGIPIIAEATPSTVEVIENDISGKIVVNQMSWYDAIEELILSTKLRNKFSKNLYSVIQKKFSSEVSSKRLILYLDKFQKKEIVSFEKIKINFMIEKIIFLMSRITHKVKKVYN